MQEYLNNLNWRYATKKFDSSKKLSDEQESLLIEAARMAPASYGLPFYKLVVVKNDETRKKLLSAAWNQPQITDSHAVFVFAIRTDVNEDMVNDYINHVMQERGTSEEDNAQYKEMMLGTINSMSQDELEAWARNQAYIALGFVLDAAAQNEMDACPMEGFAPAQFDEILNLEEQNLKSVVICTVGFRSDEDKYASLPKVRLAKKDFVIEK